MQLTDLLQTKGAVVHTIAPDASVAELVAALARHGVGALVVSTDGHTIDGIVSERDIVRRLHHRGLDALDERVRMVMTAAVRTAAPGDTTEQLMALMTEHRIRHVPVVEGGRLTGIVSIGDVVKARMHELQHENDTLHHYITAR